MVMGTSKQQLQRRPPPKLPRTQQPMELYLLTIEPMGAHLTMLITRYPPIIETITEIMVETEKSLIQLLRQLQVKFPLS